MALLPVAVDAQNLREGFLTPPQEARPRVWWHWMDGNITREGIKKDIEWMNRAGIGGFHCFEAALGTEPIVPERVVYMSPQWKDCFQYAMHLADSLGMETAIASCPGWSNTGGPWVKPEQAMKRLVWTETRIKGGRNVSLTVEKPKWQQWYSDVCVLAVRVNTIDLSMADMGAKSSVGGTDQQPFYLIELNKAYTVKALRIADGFYRSIWAAQPAPVVKHLEASFDGVEYRRVCDLPHGSIYNLTVNIPPTTARFFRVVYDKKPSQTPEVELFTIPKINHAEEKAGFATPSDMMDYKTVAEQEEAVPQADVVDITACMDTAGLLKWKAPKGNWRILRYGYTLTGKTNHPAPREATGLEVSKIDREAFTDFLEHYIQLYSGATDGRLPQYLLIDSYEAGHETWMPRMMQEFEARRGYSLLPWMPVLTGIVVGSAEQSEEFLFDWRTTIGELIEECMYQNAAQIAARHGMKTYFESHENGRLYLVDGMAAKSKADIPMAAMWVVEEQQKTDNSSSFMGMSDIRESASVAHLYGKKYVACESMTVNGYANGAYCFYPGNLKHTADLEMASGVNRFVIHECAHQPVDDKVPGLGLLFFGQWFNRHETWAEQARAWTDYLARSCFMLQQGHNVADVLYYYGEDDVVTSLFAHKHPDVPASYNYDYVNKEALLSLVDFDGEYITAPSGARYRALVIDSRCCHFAPAVQQKLEALRSKGAVVVDLSRQSMDDALRNVAPDFRADNMNGLKFVHRTTPEAEIYWVCNTRPQAKKVKAFFRVCGRVPSLWHPETGAIEKLTYMVNDGVTVVDLPLVENDAVFVVFEAAPVAPERGVAPELQLVDCRQIVSPWTVRFDERWGGPAQTVFPQLISYTESADPGIKYYAGTAVYTNAFKLAKKDLKNASVVINLGLVGCIAEVVVNGIPMGTLWKSPYRVDITRALKKGINQLEIRVVNNWANRLIGDEQPDCKQRFTYTATKFYKADSPLLPAGLIGPVHLSFYRLSY